jgi:simple sugar transport system substrate-binding protein
VSRKATRRAGTRGPGTRRAATRAAPWLLALLLLLLAAGCGGSTVRRDAPVVVAGGSAPLSRPAERPGPRGAVRIAVVTHGQASSPFWAIVRNGVFAAARQLDVLVSYRAPEIHSVPRMETLIGDAIASKPNGLVVSLPDPALAPSVRRAIEAGIPTITINSGQEIARRLGVMAHVGQPEEPAGLAAGRRFTAAGARRALCVNQHVGNVGLNARCRGLERAMRAAGGSSRVLSVDDTAPETPERIAAAVENGRIDAVLTLNATTALLAVQALRGKRGVIHGTFDLGPDVLAAVRDGRIAFAIDQQAYLQGYWPVVMLAQHARYGLLPGRGEMLPTGPNFVTRRNAGRVIALSRRSIR